MVNTDFTLDCVWISKTERCGKAAGTSRSLSDLTASCWPNIIINFWPIKAPRTTVQTSVTITRPIITLTDSRKPKVRISPLLFLVTRSIRPFFVSGWSGGRIVGPDSLVPWHFRLHREQPRQRSNIFNQLRRHIYFDELETRQKLDHHFENSRS